MTKAMELERKVIQRVFIQKLVAFCRKRYQLYNGMFYRHLKASEKAR